MDIFSNIPVISPDKEYWFIRTFGGEVFLDYYDKEYVGIGLNNVPQEYIVNAKQSSSDFLILQNFIHNNSGYQNGSATKMARDLVSFQHDMQIGDSVIIPNRDSEQLAFGIIQSDVYIEANTDTFVFKNKYLKFLEKRRRVKWIKLINRFDLNGELRPLISQHHGLTNANIYADVIEGTVDSLYIKNNKAHFTLKINQDEAINAFELNRFLEGLCYFYQEFAKEYNEDVNEELYIKIKLQSKGGIALKGIAYAGMFGIASMIAVSNNSSINLKMGEFKLEGSSDGPLNTISDFLDKREERRERAIIFQDSIENLKAKRYDESLSKPMLKSTVTKVNFLDDSVKKIGNEPQATGEN